MLNSAENSLPVPLAVTAAYQPECQVPADLVNHPRYDILEKLGQGGMGAVYKAQHKVMNRLVALKVINAKFVDNPLTAERFHREVQAAAQLHHPNIVTAYDADCAGDTHFLVMEFIAGTDLAKYVAKTGPLPVEEACRFIREAATGLQHAHEQGMVHRDIKPHNLLLSVSGLVKVADFGLARLPLSSAADTGLTGENVLMGTADYIAPEQVQNPHTVDIRADIYSLGCTLYHLLMGCPPLQGDSVGQKIAAHLSGAAALAKVPVSLPKDLRAVLTRMLAKNPLERYQSPGEVAKALVPFVSDATTVKGAAPLAEQYCGHRWPSPALLCVGIVVALVLAALGIWSVNLWHQSPVRPEGPVASTLSEPKQAEGLPSKYKNRLGIEFVLVPAGKFLMGGGGETVGIREIVIPYDFYLGTYEVTQEEWKTVTSFNPSWFSRYGTGKDAVHQISDLVLQRFPVESVSWKDTQEFLELLNAREKQPGWVYRLPKSVEWEYACRGGPTPNKVQYAYHFYFETPTNQLFPNQANFGHSLAHTCKVGSYQPNCLGLYNMHGNVHEWCDDEQIQPDGSSHRVARGGWDNDASHCRAAHHWTAAPWFRHEALGLRVARVPVGQGSK